jgi:hypothetical protein
MRKFCLPVFPSMCATELVPKLLVSLLKFVVGKFQQKFVGKFRSTETKFINIVTCPEFRD